MNILNRTVFSLPLGLWVLLVSLLVFSTYLRAENTINERGFSTEQESQLNTLFKELKHAQSEEASYKHVKKIWHIWLNPADVSLNALMSQAVSYIRHGDFDNALKTLNRIVAKWPSYPEGRNQRAVVYFAQNEFEKSLIDIAKTLELEPRHFGSLAGKAVIHLRKGENTLGFNTIIEAMKIYPYIPDRYLLPPGYDPKLLEEEKTVI